MKSSYKWSPWIALCTSVALARVASADDAKSPNMQTPTPEAATGPEEAGADAPAGSEGARPPSGGHAAAANPGSGRGQHAKAEQIAKDQQAVKQTEAAVASARPQLLAIRGGSLGFPMASNNQGLLAGADAKLVGGSILSSKSAADAFAKVGGVDIGRVSAELIGESFEADVPQVSLIDQLPKPAMTPTTFASVGIRVRWNRYPTVWATKPISSECVGALMKKIESPPKRPRDLENTDKSELMKEINVDVESAKETNVPGCDPDDLAALTQTASLSVIGGLRMVRRGNADEGLTDLSGIQWEIGIRRDSEAQIDSRFSWSLMGGISGLHLNRSDVTNGMGMATTRYLQMNDVRLSFAAEVRRAASKEAAETSAFGVYGVASRNYWTNKFQPDGSSKVRDLQLEGGIYVSGAMKGFSGLIMLSIIRPYTPESQYVYAVSVVPFGGGVPASSGTP
jgi:hypothetical protein